MNVNCMHVIHICFESMQLANVNYFNDLILISQQSMHIVELDGLLFPPPLALDCTMLDNWQTSIQIRPPESR